ncbi:MAG: sulfite exporter TauE/SafE family protein [bacterium]|nr:sulfite exporter TauE/SafE family protein [bacterium]
MFEGSFFDLAVHQWVLVGFVLLIASIIQSAAGFGAGLFATPLLLAIDFSLPEIISINVTLSAIQSGWGYFQLRRHIQVRKVVRPIAIRIMSIPIGAAALYLMSNSLGDESRNAIKMLVGVAILMIVILQLSLRIQPREKIASYWEWIAFSASGLLVGWIGMGGPPAVLWVQAHLWEPLKSRAYLFLIMVSSVPFHLMLLFYLFPPADIMRGVGVGLLNLPCVLAGVTIGMAVGKRFSRLQLRAVVYLLLILIAIYAITVGMLSYFAPSP